MHPPYLTLRHMNRRRNAGPPGREIFKKWMEAQAPQRLSKADAELVIDEASGNSSTTEPSQRPQLFA